RVEPGGKGGLITEQFQASVHLEQRFLGQVVRVRVRAGKSARESAYLRQVTREQRLESADVALLRALDQFIQLLAARHCFRLLQPGTSGAYAASTAHDAALRLALSRQWADGTRSVPRRRRSHAARSGPAPRPRAARRPWAGRRRSHASRADRLGRADRKRTCPGEP